MKKSRKKLPKSPTPAPAPVHYKWIRVQRKFPLPDYVKVALKRLDEAGHVAYVVGGSVRDFLLGRPCKDQDIATSASPDELCGLFPTAVTVGKAFGVIKVPLRPEDFREGDPVSEFLEIATFREDLEYRDHRHPTAVRFSGPLEDARRRDFTVNALYFDSKTNRILDSTGGMDDLRGRVLRAIGDPRERFREDALRLLRAVRFTTSLDFKLEEATAAAVCERARLILQVSGERIRDELNLMWTGPRPADALKLLSDLKLLELILPEVDALKRAKAHPAQAGEGDVWVHTLKFLRVLAQDRPERTPEMTWAALLHDAGKAVLALKPGMTTFTGHEQEGAKLAETIGNRLKMSREQISQVSTLVQDLIKFREVFQMREATVERFVREPHFEDLLALHRANSIASDGNLAFHEFAFSRFQAARGAAQSGAARLPVKLIDGKDLIQLGFLPGPTFARILREVEDLALERKLSTKEQALEYVIQNHGK